jgi:DNA-binding response OmpR family regulator
LPARILVVDDEPMVREVLRLFLERKGHTVIPATSGEEGLRTFQNAPDDVDLVVTDSHMPGLHGEKMVAAIRRLRPKLPILMLSGFGDRRLEERTKSGEIDCFMTKPITRDELLATVERLLRAETCFNGVSSL